MIKALQQDQKKLNASKYTQEADRSVESMMRDVLNKGAWFHTSFHATPTLGRRGERRREIDLTNLQVFVVFWQGCVLCLDVVLLDLKVLK